MRVQGLGFRVWVLVCREFPKIRGIIFLGIPYKDPTILGAILRVPLVSETPYRFEELPTLVLGVLHLRLSSLSRDDVTITMLTTACLFV